MTCYLFVFALILNSMVSHASTIESFISHAKKIPIEEVEIDDPHAGKINYKGYPLHKLLDIKFSGWNKKSHILFVASDGYQSEVPVKDILNYRPFLAIGIVGKKTFQFYDKLQKKTQALGPAYLVWDRATHKELYNRSTLFWPYQIVQIDMISKEVSKKKSPGYSFDFHCSSCHKEQNYGAIPSASVISLIVKNQTMDQFDIFLRKPDAIKKNSTMPPINLTKPELESVYLWLKNKK